MRYIYTYKVDRNIISNLMGHTNLSSLDKYDNPPQELLLEFMTASTNSKMESIGFNHNTKKIDKDIEEMRKELWQ